MRSASCPSSSPSQTARTSVSPSSSSKSRPRSPAASRSHSPPSSTSLMTRATSSPSPSLAPQTTRSSPFSPSCSATRTRSASRQSLVDQSSSFKTPPVSRSPARPGCWAKPSPRLEAPQCSQGLPSLWSASTRCQCSCSRRAVSTFAAGTTPPCRAPVSPASQLM